MRLANLNVFIPSLILAEAFLSTPVTMAVSLLILPFRLVSREVVDALAGAVLFGLPKILILLFLIVVAVKFDLSPLNRKPECERRYRAGHWVLGITSAVVVIAIVAALSWGWIYHDTYGISAFFVAFAIAPAFLTWFIGLLMVWSSRA